jgi:hypothetical protein
MVRIKSAKTDAASQSGKKYIFGRALCLAVKRFDLFTVR